MATDQIYAKALSTIVRLISEASKEDATKQQWPIFAKYHVFFAASMSVYMAAATSEKTVRLTLLQTCKDAIPILNGWSMFPKDQLARVTRHILRAISRVEARALDAVSSNLRLPSVSARMAANIPYQVIWNAKHNRTPDPVELTATLPPASTYPTDYQPTPSGSRSTTSLPRQDGLLYSFQGSDDGLNFEDMNDADFTDIFLDWQSLREGVPDWI
ncbi:hypothetical protein LTR37_004149 [Vermiconidia calcicola]|uniref:Uncharacterized protein n=1 Tax=Vermiconidia calcicola TaxID=1690605 RepID=A0ACC3NMK0_9PEZI|nr:hypothetical protein LTR37_004149 [Vermiconidia calcicola]